MTKARKRKLKKDEEEEGEDEEEEGLEEGDEDEDEEVDVDAALELGLKSMKNKFSTVEGGDAVALQQEELIHKMLQTARVEGVENGDYILKSYINSAQLTEHFQLFLHKLHLELQPKR